MRVLSASIFVLTAAIVTGIFVYGTQITSGSVSVGQEYKYVNYTSTDAGATSTALGSNIGSIIVNNAGSAGAINFYATSSQATTSSELMFGFDGAAGEGVYAYDLNENVGILVDVTSAFNGDVVVTYR